MLKRKRYIPLHHNENILHLALLPHPPNDQQIVSQKANFFSLLGGLCLRQNNLNRLQNCRFHKNIKLEEKYLDYNLPVHHQEDASSH